MASIGVAASGVFAATDLAACTLQPTEGDAPEQLGTILESVATTGPQDVWVVGSHVVGGVSTAYAERWDGAAWTVQDLHLPPGPTSISSLYDVTAFGPDDVWAVGTWMGDDPLIRHWDGTTWSAERAPDAAGHRAHPDRDRRHRARRPVGRRPATDRRPDARRRAAPHAPRAGASCRRRPDAAVLHDVAMLQPGVPMVAGWSIGKQGYADALLAARETGAWTREGVPAAPGRNVFLTGLAIGRPGAAWAVGFSNEGPNGDAPVALRRSGDGWKAVAGARPGRLGPARVRRNGRRRHGRGRAGVDGRARAGARAACRRRGLDRRSRGPATSRRTRSPG